MLCDEIDGRLAARDLQLVQDRADVPADRRLRDEQSVGDLPRGEALAETVEDVPLALGQLVLAPAHEPGLTPPGAGPEFADQPRGELAREGRLPLKDADERRAEPGRVHPL